MLTAASRAGARPRLITSVLLLVLMVGLFASSSTAAADDSAEGERDTRTTSRVTVEPSADRPQIPKSCAQGVPYIDPAVRPCVVGAFKRRRPTLMLWGDSHALQMLPALQAATKGRGVNLVMMSIGGCPALKYRHTPGQDPASCAGFNADALAVVARLKKLRAPLRVVIGNYWHGYAVLHQGLADGSIDRAEQPDHVLEATRVFHRRGPGLLRQLRRMDVPVDLIGHTATTRWVRTPCAQGEEPYVCDIPRRLAMPHARRTNTWLESLIEPFGRRSRVIDTSPAYCTKRVCKGLKGGIHTFFDSKHISATRAATLGRFFVPSVRRLKKG